MSTDWREKEREFLTGLKPDTGRDLGEWMRVISAQNLPHRNDMIDWLRQQGFTFARASWLERIHHNAGRPIYLDAAWAENGASGDLIETIAEETRLAVAVGGGRVLLAPVFTPPPPAPPPPAPAPAQISTPPSLVASPPPQPASSAAAASERTVVAVSHADGSNAHANAARVSPRAPHGNAVSACAPGEIDETLAKAKAYRPLAAFLLREIEAAVPGVAIGAGASHLVLSREGVTFALLAISGKDLRLALASIGPHEGNPLQPVKLPVTLAKAAHGMPHMAVLTDVRQVNAGLVNIIKAAAGLVEH